MKLPPAQIRLLKKLSAAGRSVNIGCGEWKSWRVLRRLELAEAENLGIIRITEAGQAALKDL